jgi:ArsR family metal-binding transcriptional regulator
MKFEDVEEDSTTPEKKQYPNVKMTTKLERIIKKGTTDKGSWIVLGFERGNSAIYFAKNKEEINQRLDGIEIGNLVSVELSGSRKGNVLKSIEKHEGGESDSPSSSRLSDKDMEAFIPSFKCGCCGEQNLQFKQELKNFIISIVRSCHEKN